MQRTKSKYTGKIIKNLTVELKAVNDTEPSPLILLIYLKRIFYSFLVRDDTNPLRITVGSYTFLLKTSLTIGSKVSNGSIG